MPAKIGSRIVPKCLRLNLRPGNRFVSENVESPTPNAVNFLASKMPQEGSQTCNVWNGVKTIPPRWRRGEKKRRQQIQISPISPQSPNAARYLVYFSRGCTSCYLLCAFSTQHPASRMPGDDTIAIRYSRGNAMEDQRAQLEIEDLKKQEIVSQSSDQPVSPARPIWLGLLAFCISILLIIALALLYYFFLAN